MGTEHRRFAGVVWPTGREGWLSPIPFVDGLPCGARGGSADVGGSPRKRLRGVAVKEERKAKKESV
jgi:hypothetical protein